MLGMVQLEEVVTAGKAYRLWLGSECCAARHSQGFERWAPRFDRSAEPLMQIM